MRAVLVLAALAVPAAARGDGYPVALIERPQVLPGGLVEIAGAIDHEERRALGIETLSAESLDLGAAVGLGGRWQLGAATSFRVHPEAGWDRGLALGAAVAAWRGERIDLAPAASLPLSFHTGYDLVSTLDLGLGLRARLGERVFLTAGRRLMPIDLRPALAWNAALDAGVGLQVTRALALLAGARLGQVTLVGAIDRSESFLDRLPAELTLLHATGRIDTALDLAADLDDPRSELRVVLRMGVRP